MACLQELINNLLGVWTPSSIEVLRSIARSSTVRNGLSVSTAFHHLVERLSVQLYLYRMILHFWALHPHLEDDWLEACTSWEFEYSHQSQNIMDGHAYTVDDDGPKSTVDIFRPAAVDDDPVWENSIELVMTSHLCKEITQLNFSLLWEQ